MTQRKRTDIHRPSVINPDDYEFVAFLLSDSCLDELGACQFLQAERAALRAHMKHTGGTFSGHDHGGTCHVCGAWAATTIVWYHEPSNTYVETGEICGDKMGFSQGSELNAFRKKVKSALEYKAGKAKAKAILDDLGIPGAWDIGMTPYNDLPDKFEETTVRDMVQNLIRYGSFSAKQEAFITKLMKRIEDRPRIEAERAAEKAKAKPIPDELLTGRHTFTGTICGTKWVDHDFGCSLKMFFKDDRGFTLWGTVPRAIEGECEKDSRIQFDAAVSAAPDDNTHGFFSRPTKPSLFQEAA